MTPRAPLFAAVLVASAFAATTAALSDSHSHAAAPEPKAAAAEPVTPPLPGLPAGRQPFHVVRELRALQDEVALGRDGALQRQREFMAHVSDDMRAFPAAVWDEPINQRAAVVYALSGGDPRALKLLLGRSTPAAVDESLLRGALAFAEGRAADAIKRFEKLDVRALDASLAGLVALVHGTLLAKSDPAKAVPLLDEARLLAPGTLVEESALRQVILLAARQANFERFDTLSSQYARRYAKSLYAANFRRQFFAGVARQDFAGTSEWISRAEAEFARLPPEDRAESYLSVAREAVLGGNLAIARYAAGKARNLMTPGTGRHAEAQLYGGAAMLLSDQPGEYEKGRDMLLGVARDKLDQAGVELLDAAGKIAGGLRAMPSPPAESSEPDRPLVVRAATVVADVDTLLAEDAR